eukprot:CFRG6614T1
MCIWWLFRLCCEEEDDSIHNTREGRRHVRNRELAPLLAQRDAGGASNSDAVQAGEGFLHGQELNRFQDANLTDAQIMHKVHRLSFKDTLLQSKWEGGGAGMKSSESSKMVECAICMEEYRHGDDVQFLPCLHVYHTECIDNWFERSLTCPLCMTHFSATVLQASTNG